MPRDENEERRDERRHGAGNRLHFLWKIPIVSIYAAIHEVTPLRRPVLWWTVLLMLLGQDFFYYWSHRGHHVIRVLWACHVVHHSSLLQPHHRAAPAPTTCTVWPFYVPLIALGADPAALAFCSSVNLVYQFWIHTERINKMPRWFEFVLNTPSHHRVHHASQGVIFYRTSRHPHRRDPLFGSFVAETELPVDERRRTSPRTTPCVATQYAAIARDLKAATGWRERAGRVFRAGQRDAEVRHQPVTEPVA